MKFINNIACEGILEKSEISKIKSCDLSKQIMVSHTFEIPSEKPDIECVLCIYINTRITKKKMITAVDGIKIIFHGIMYIKVIYVGKNPEQSVHSAHFEQNFYSFIKFDKECDEDCRFFDIKSYIEDIEPVLVNQSKIELTTLILNCLNCENKCECDKIS